MYADGRNFCHWSSRTDEGLKVGVLCPCPLVMLIVMSFCLGLVLFFWSLEIEANSFFLLWYSTNFSYTKFDERTWERVHIHLSSWFTGELSTKFHFSIGTEIRIGLWMVKKGRWNDKLEFQPVFPISIGFMGVRKSMILSLVLFF